MMRIKHHEVQVIPHCWSDAGYSLPRLGVASKNHAKLGKYKQYT